jgi:uncharacterized protein (TIGR04552 family)
MAADDGAPVPTHVAGDLVALRLLLAGESVLDLSRYCFGERPDVDRFLRLCCFDTDNPLDLSRLSELHGEALSYLADTHGVTVPSPVASPTEIHDLFLQAAGDDPGLRRASCTTLKVMHVLHHINGRELDFHTAMPEAELFQRVTGKVFSAIDRMRAAGVDLVEFAAGKKSRASQVTKLLAKRSNLATQIFDKVRFRIIVKSRDDLVRTLVYLMRNLFPFNYVVPEQSHNGIVTLEDVARVLQVDREQARPYWLGSSPAAGADPYRFGPPNECSGRSYRSVIFVADIPLRIDDVAPGSVPAVAFVKAEIQVVDEETAQANEAGENAHALYKLRQHKVVRDRLSAGGPLVALAPRHEPD